MAGDPFAIVEAMTICGIATRSERGFLYVRGEYPGRRARGSPARPRPARAAGLLGARHRGFGPPLRHRDPPRRRRLHLRRGDGALQLDRGQARRAAIEAAVSEPGRRCSASRPWSTTSRRWPTCSPILLEGGAAWAAHRHARPRPARGSSACRATSRGPGSTSCRSASRSASVLELRRRRRRRSPLQAILLGGAAGMFVGPESLDLPLTFEDTRAAGAHARLGRRHGLRRHGRSARPAGTDRGRSSRTRAAASACRAGSARCGSGSCSSSCARPAAPRSRRTAGACWPNWVRRCATPRSAGSARRRRRPSNRPSSGCTSFEGSARRE